MFKIVFGLVREELFLPTLFAFKSATRGTLQLVLFKKPYFYQLTPKGSFWPFKPALKFVTTSSIIFIPVHAVADPKCGVKVTFVIFNNG